MNALLTQQKQTRRSLSIKIAGWAQVALLCWMMAWGDFSSRLEYVAVGTARIDCAPAQPEVPTKGEPSGSERVNPTQCDGYGALPGTTKPSALVAGANVASQLGWRGHYIDPTGFYYMGARNYAPDSGTFLSPDPLGHSASMDLYSYCDGDPVNQYDADGRIGKGAATGVALGGFGQYDNTTQQIAGLVGQIGSYFIPGMQGYSTARDITFSGYSASKAAYDIGQNGANLSNVSELAMSASGLIPGGRAVGTALRGESSAVFQEVRQTINVGAARGTGAIDVAALDFSTGANKAVFYSGPGNRARALAFADRTGAMPIDLTPGGKYLNSLNLYDTLPAAQADAIWSQASRQFAAGAEGKINLFINGARPDRVFHTIERPLIEANPTIYKQTFHY